MPSRAGLALVAALAGVASAEAPARVEKPAYVAAISGPGDALRGVPATARVTVSVRGGFHVNADYPASFKPAAAEGGAIHYPVAKVDKTSGLATEPCGADRPKESCAVLATIPYLAGAAGAQSVGGVIAFSVCDDEQCLIEKVALALPITVK